MPDLLGVTNPVPGHDNSNVNRNMPVSPSILDMYLYETNTLLEQLDGILLAAEEADTFSEDSVNEIFRIMHTRIQNAPDLNRVVRSDNRTERQDTGDAAGGNQALRAVSELLEP